MDASTEKQIRLTVIIGSISAAIAGLVFLVVTHWQEILGVTLLVVAWVLSLPAWVWLCLSILTACRWIARAIKAKGKSKGQG